jgi:hypothetical protein
MKGNQSMSKLTLASEPKEVMENTRPILQPIYEALETAVPNASHLIAEQGWTYTALLYSHLVRADVKAKLHGRQCPIEFDDIAREVVMDAVCNEGLSTVFEELTIKIFKGTVLPRAASNRRESFYQHTLPGMTPDSQTAQLRSLVVLWDCDTEGANLKLWLCCPKDKYGASVWLEPIPHPSEWMVVAASTSSSTDDFDDLLKSDDPNKKTGEE